MRRLIFAVLLFLGFSQVEAGPGFTGANTPYLLWTPDQLVVRISDKRVDAPYLEWKTAQSSGSLKMKKTRWHTWQGAVPHSLLDFSYRIKGKKELSQWVKVDLPPRDAKSIRFAVYGDNRSGYDTSAVHQSILRGIASDKPAFILHTGDLVYRGDNVDNWRIFLADGQNVFDHIPLFPSMGNHDRSQFDRFRQLFPMWKWSHNYYAFRYGPAYFIALDSTVAFSTGTDQYEFLQRELEKWHKQLPIIVFFHHAPFSTGKHGSNRRVIRYLVPLFEEYGVDVVFTGHDHIYERIGPINGVLYIVTGGGGGPLYDMVTDPWVKSFKKIFHYVLVEIKKGRIHLWMKNAEGDVYDKINVPIRLEPVPADERVPHPKLPKAKRGFG